MTTLPNPFDTSLTGGWRTASYSSPGFEHHVKVAKSARGEPGVWFDLATGRTSKSAYGLISGQRHKPSLPFRPVGAFEFRAERRTDGFAVQVRHVGTP